MCQEEVGIFRRGTNVEVHNLFGDVPVRFKQLSLRYALSSGVETTFGRVKEMLVGYLLACPQHVELRFFLRGNKNHQFCCNSSKLNSSQISLESTASVLFQAKLLNIVDTKQWRSVSVRTASFSIRAAISMEPSPSKSAQFISVGQLPIRRRQGSNIFFDTIDRLFEASNFGVLEDGPISQSNDDGRQVSERKAGDTGKLAKGIDRWPIYYLRIDTKSEPISSLAGQDEPTADALPVIDHLTKALESLVSHFLIGCGFANGHKVRKTHSVRSRGNPQEDAREQLHPELPASAVPRGATEARYLKNWNRVKSARPSGENFHYGLAFENSADHLDVAGDVIKEEPLLNDQDAGDMLHDAAGNDTEVNDDSTVGESVSLVWTNPRNGRSIDLNPRTGAIMPASTSQNASRSEGCCGHQCEHQQCGATYGPRNPLSNRAKPPTTSSTFSLGKHINKTSLQHTEAPITSVAFEELLAFNGKPPADGLDSDVILLSQAVTRSALAAATIINQFDRKFVLIAINVLDRGTGNLHEQKLAVLVDQHAADERIKFEELCQDLCKRTSTSFSRPLVFEVDEVEARLFEKRKAHFQLWCLDYNLTQQHLTGPRKHQVWTIGVTAMPSLIAERCRAEPRLLIDLMRREIWSARARSEVVLPSPTSHGGTTSWWSELAHCPEGIIEILKSRSCRTAIMFNDVLSVEQCGELVLKLSKCSFPFQCAHGRPTLTVLADLEDVDSIKNIGSVGMGNSNSTVEYGDAWGDWIDD